MFTAVAGGGGWVFKAATEREGAATLSAISASVDKAVPSGVLREVRTMR